MKFWPKHAHCWLSASTRSTKSTGAGRDELHALAEASGYTVSDTDGRAVETFQLDEYVLTANGNVTRMLSSIYTTWRDRGATDPDGASAIRLAGLQSKVLRRRFLEKRIHDYRMLIDLAGSRHQPVAAAVWHPRSGPQDPARADRPPGHDGLRYRGEYRLLRADGTGPDRTRGQDACDRAVAIEHRTAQTQSELNGEGERITVLEGAVSDTPGTASFHLSAHSNLGTFHANGSAAHMLSGEQISVRTYTVPELAAEHGAPDLIRMDVEGP